MPTSSTPGTPTDGGVAANRTPWTGGRRAQRNVDSMSPCCFRLENPDKLMKVYKPCTTPLATRYVGLQDADMPLA